MNYPKMLETLKTESDNFNKTNPLDVFLLNEGVFGGRRGWNSSTKSIFRSDILASDHYKVDDNGNPLEVILTGVKAGEYDSYSPTEEDASADDWAVIVAIDKKVVKVFK